MNVIKLLDELAFAVADRRRSFKLANNPQTSLAHQAAYPERWEVSKREIEAIVGLIRAAQTEPKGLAATLAPTAARSQTAKWRAFHRQRLAPLTGSTARSDNRVAFKSREPFLTQMREFSSKSRFNLRS